MMRASLVIRIPAGWRTANHPGKTGWFRASPEVRWRCNQGTSATRRHRL